MLYSMVLCSALLAQAPAPAPAAARPPAAGSVVGNQPFGYPAAYFNDLWAQREQAAARGDFKRAAQLLQEISENKHRAGWPDLAVMGEALVIESSAASAAGDGKRAQDLATYAMDLAPHRLAGYTAMASAQWAAGDSKGSFKTLASSVAMLAMEPPYVWARVGNALLMLLYGSLGAVLTFVFAAYYRHSPALEHEIRVHMLRNGASRIQVTLICAVPLLLPALLRLGPAWCALVWMLLLTPFMAGRERWAAGGALVLLMATSLALPEALRPVAYAGSRAEDMYRTLRLMEADDAATRLAHQENLQPAELYALGLRARWRGDLRQARDFFNRAEQGGAAFAELPVSQANLLYLAGDVQGAVAAYTKLLGQDPGDVLVAFNLSQVLLSMADTRAEEARRRANDLNVHLVAKLEQWTQRSGMQLVDPDVPRSLLAASGRATFDTPEGDAEYQRIVAQVWRSFGGAAPRLVFVIMTGVALAWLLLTSLPAQVRRWAHTCRRCGLAACAACTTQLAAATLCNECQALSDRGGAPVDQQLRIKKEIETHRYHARALGTQRVFNLFFAGAGQLVRGNAIAGLLLTVLFLSLAAGLASGFGLMPEMTPGYGSSVGVLNVAGAVVLVVVYIWAVWDGQREKV